MSTRSNHERIRCFFNSFPGASGVHVSWSHSCDLQKYGNPWDDGDYVATNPEVGGLLEDLIFRGAARDQISREHEDQHEAQGKDAQCRSFNFVQLQLSLERRRLDWTTSGYLVCRSPTQGSHVAQCLSSRHQCRHPSSHPESSRFVSRGETQSLPPSSMLCKPGPCPTNLFSAVKL